MMIKDIDLQQIKSDHIKILEPLKVKWKLCVDLKTNNDLAQIYTGEYSNQEPIQLKKWDINLQRYVPLNPKTFLSVTPFTFQGILVPTGYYHFTGSAGLNFYIQGLSNFNHNISIEHLPRLLDDIASGKRILSQGISGTWTFKKHGTKIKIIPV